MSFLQTASAKESEKLEESFFLLYLCSKKTDSPLWSESIKKMFDKT
jgi:hypothetical protein